MSDISDIDDAEAKAPAIWGIALQYVIAVVCFIGEDIGLFSLPEGIGWSFLGEVILFVGCLTFFDFSRSLSDLVFPSHRSESRWRNCQRYLLKLLFTAAGMFSALCILYVWESLA